MDGWHNAADVAPSHVFVEVPTVRPADPLAREIGDRLYRITRNYEREGTGPGSRFEGQLLEDVMAVAVVGWLLQTEESLTGLPMPVLPARMTVDGRNGGQIELRCEQHGTILAAGSQGLRTLSFEARRHWRESHGSSQG